MDLRPIVNDVADNQAFVVDRFFDPADLDLLEKVLESCQPARDVIASEGPFQGQLIVSYTDVTDNINIQDFFREKLQPIFGTFAFNVIVKQTLHLPWDIHADNHLERTASGFVPWYNLLVPLEDIDSRTIVFDQITHDRDDFSSYKKTHPKLSVPIPLDFWQQNLSMCWSEDRYYASVKQVMSAQKRGQLQAIPRWHFHSSDNWHVRYPGRSKSFVQIRIDKHSDHDSRT